MKECEPKKAKIIKCLEENIVKTFTILGKAKIPQDTKGTNYKTGFHQNVNVPLLKRLFY